MCGCMASYSLKRTCGGVAVCGCMASYSLKKTCGGVAVCGCMASYSVEDVRWCGRESAR